MPGKARRVASRQAQLSRRRKRQQRPPSDTQLLAPVPTAVDGQQDGTETPPVLEPTKATRSRGPVRPSQAVARSTVSASAVASTRVPSRARREHPATNVYVGAEVRRICIMSAIVLAVIIVLGIVL